LPVAGTTKPSFVTRPPDGAERALFHDSSLAALPLLSASPETAPRARWLLGAALGALGRYGEARAVLTALDGPYASLAASTIASHYRQLGRHAEARSWDDRALDLAGDDPEALFDARLGLAADAVGAGDLAGARTGLAAVPLLAACDATRRVSERVASHGGGGWRQRVRIGWVETEIALLSGDPSGAIRAATAGLAMAKDAAAPRHIAKCLLFLGASQHAAAENRPDEAMVTAAVATLERAAAAAGTVGATPLTWVIEYLLARRCGSAGHAQRHRLAAAAAVQDIAAGLPDPDKSLWLERPDIAGIVSVST